MVAPASRLVCTGCGAGPRVDEPYPFRCPNAGSGDVDHVLSRVLDVDRVAFPADGEQRTFLRYRGLLHSYHRAMAGGLTDGDFVSLVGRIDAAVADVDGHGFTVTPFLRSAVVSDALGFTRSGGVWIKDETANVSGSHKGRHMMGLVLHLEVAEMLGVADPTRRPDLAVASCGNAALAAAVLARAVGRRLEVFVPVDADRAIVHRLEDLDAEVVACPRRAGESGDPTYARLREALAAGALPFTCQGSENGLVIEGGETLGYEIVSEVVREGLALDHVVVQVGGGALASACVQSLDEAVGLGALARLPHVHTVQTASGHPLERAWEKVSALLPATPTKADVARALKTAATHRSAFMWPWEQEPKSIATGILDDETYDWLAVVRGMLESDGRPAVVSEDQLARAHRLGHAAGFPIDPTGSSGLAGLMELVAHDVVAPDERVAILFTGVDR